MARANANRHNREICRRGLKKQNRCVMRLVTTSEVEQGEE